jgi:hypothetical protein
MSVLGPAVVLSDNGDLLRIHMQYDFNEIIQQLLSFWSRIFFYLGINCQFLHIKN